MGVKESGWKKDRRQTRTHAPTPYPLPSQRFHSQPVPSWKGLTAAGRARRKLFTGYVLNGDNIVDVAARQIQIQITKNKWPTYETAWD